MDTKKEKAMKNAFPPKVELCQWRNDYGMYKASLSIGEEYYESDPYKEAAYALCEIKGYIDGLQIQIDGIMKVINDN